MISTPTNSSIELDPELAIVSLAPIREEAHWLARYSRAPLLRTMVEFAEQEIVIPNGPHEGRRFRIHRQPFAGVYLRTIDKGLFNRIAALGPVQSGKTLTCCAIPAMYHLFEIGENVVYGVPDMNMARDKWNEDLLPVIEKSRYRKYLPRSGPGSKGGSKLEYVRFTNGATLRFMGGGTGGSGGDARRSGFTTRVVVVTEADKIDTASESSRETDPLKQMEARTKAYGENKRIYLECTVSIEEGRIWQEYLHGTKSSLALPCPYCGKFVTPEREHLKGWDNAETENAAREGGTFHCPECDMPWEEADRKEANLNAILVHDGQTIVRKKVKGDVPPTRTLGFRWSAANNLFVAPGEIAVEEWKAAASDDPEAAEKEIRQFAFALPYIPDKLDATPLKLANLLARRGEMSRGFVPEGTDKLIVTVDVGKWLLYWQVQAIAADNSRRTIDYGVQECNPEALGVEAGIRAALLSLVEDLKPGWPKTIRSPDGQVGETRIRHDYFFVDSGYMTETVYQFCREMGHNNGYFPIKGWGQSKGEPGYTSPPKVDKKRILFAGEGYHLIRIPASKIVLMHIDADLHKEKVHESISMALEEPGSLAWFHSDDPKAHLRFCQHLLAEKQVEEFIPGKGVIRKWVVASRNNHFLDCAQIASAGGNFALRRG